MKLGRKKGIDHSDYLKLLKRYKSLGVKNTEIAKYFGVTPSTIQNWCRQLGMLDPKKVAGGKLGQKKREEKQQAV